MSEIKLLPCPFCGGEAEIGVSTIWCKNEECGVEMSICFLSQEELAKQWNTRKPMERIIERLEEEATEYEDNFGELIDCIPEHIAIEIVKEEGGIE